jgi:hypothetical protein
MIVDCGQRSTRLLWCGRETSKETGNPETHTAFIGQRTLGKKRDRGRQDDYSNAESASICRDRPPAFHRGQRNSRRDIVPRKCVGSRIQLGYIVNLEQAGLTI